MSFTTQNHYVPQWYQKRFYPAGCSEKRLFYLDLSPEKRVGGNGKPYTLKAIRRLGTELCFKEEHLYTLFFKDVSSDIVERKFFGTDPTPILKPPVENFKVEFAVPFVNNEQVSLPLFLPTRL